MVFLYDVKIAVFGCIACPSNVPVLEPNSPLDDELRSSDLSSEFSPGGGMYLRKVIFFIP